MFDSLIFAAKSKHAAKLNRLFDLSTRQSRQRRSKYIHAKATVLISSLALTAAFKACCFIDRILDKVNEGGIRIVSLASIGDDMDP
jgi:hypothetical protein